MNKGQLITYKQHFTVQTNPATSHFLERMYIFGHYTYGGGRLSVETRKRIFMKA